MYYAPNHGFPRFRPVHQVDSTFHDGFLNTSLESTANHTAQNLNAFDQFLNDLYMHFFIANDRMAFLSMSSQGPLEWTLEKARSFLIFCPRIPSFTTARPLWTLSAHCGNKYPKPLRSMPSKEEYQLAVLDAAKGPKRSASGPGCGASIFTLLMLIKFPQALPVGQGANEGAAKALWWQQNSRLSMLMLSFPSSTFHRRWQRWNGLRNVSSAWNVQQRALLRILEGHKPDLCVAFAHSCLNKVLLAWLPC